MKISAPTTDIRDLVYDPSELEAAQAIAVLVPGALSRISMFEAADSWRMKGYGLVHYRFPGLDGRPISPPLNIRQAAEEIVALAARFPNKPLRLLGFSTGGAIVLTAARQLSGDLRVALLASAVSRGGGVETFRRGVQEMAAAAMRAGTINRRRVWLEFYRVLLFGRDVLKDVELSERAEDIIKARWDKIVYPDEGRPEAHTRDLRRWTLPKYTRFAPAQARMFWGMNDTVFSKAQQMRLAGKIGAPLTGYRGQGHLIFASFPAVFEDILAHFEGTPAVTGAGVELL